MFICLMPLLFNFLIVYTLPHFGGGGRRSLRKIRYCTRTYWYCFFCFKTKAYYVLITFLKNMSMGIINLLFRGKIGKRQLLFFWGTVSTQQSIMNSVQYSRYIILVELCIRLYVQY